MIRIRVHLLLAGLAAALAVSTLALPPASAPATLPAAPTGAEFAPAIRLVRETYKADYAKTAVADRAALARKLLADGVATKDSMAARYALFVESRELAVDVGDAGLVGKAVDALAANFAGVDALEMKAKSLAKANGSRHAAAAHEAIAMACVELTYAAVAANRMDLAEQVAATADLAGQKVTKVATLTAVRARLGEYRTIATEYARIKEPRESLAKNPDDSDAAGRVGKFHGLYRGDWSTAIPLLAVGSDETLKALAVKDAVSPADAIAQAALGHAWWEYAGTLSGMPRSNAAKRAVYWYNRALPDITGITRQQIQQRIKATEPGVSETQPAKLDVLGLIDTAKDTVEGTWKVANGALVCEKFSYGRLQLPVVAPEEYDLRVVFSRNDGDGPVVLLMTGGAGAGHAFGWAMDVQGNQARFETVDGKIKAGNPTATEFRLDNNRQYNVVVRVRRDGVAAYVDEKLVREYKTDFKDMSRYSRWKLTDNHHLGLGASGGKVVFFKIELTAVSGDFKKTREK